MDEAWTNSCHGIDESTTQSALPSEARSDVLQVPLQVPSHVSDENIVKGFVVSMPKFRTPSPPALEPPWGVRRIFQRGVRMVGLGSFVSRTMFINHLESKSL